MPGTRVGGLKTVQTNKERYGDDFYQKIGTLGGAKSRKGGFYVNRELAREAGRKGGSRSKRGAIQKVETEARDTAKQHKTWKERIGL